MKDLPTRTLIAVLLIGLLALVLWLGGWTQAAVLGLFSAVAIYEMYEIFKKKDIHPFIVPQLLLAVSMYAVMYAFGVRYVLPLAVCAFTAIMIERILNKKRTALDAVAGMFMLIYPLSLLGCLGLIGFGRNDLSRIALFCCFAGPCMADNTAYMLGSTFGKHKLCPAISPNKTVEGAIGGVAGGALGGVIAYFAQKLWGLDVSLPLLVGICFICGIVGQFGDLFSSTFKRWAGVKDYGNIFPGHGGVMDRLDSAMVSAPLVAVFFMLFVK